MFGGVLSCSELFQVWWCLRFLIHNPKLHKLEKRKTSSYRKPLILLPNHQPSIFWILKNLSISLWLQQLLIYLRKQPIDWISIHQLNDLLTLRICLVKFQNLTVLKHKCFIVPFHKYGYLSKNCGGVVMIWIKPKFEFTLCSDLKMLVFS